MPLPSPDERQRLAQVDPEIAALMASPQYLSQQQPDYSDPLKGLMQLRAFFDKFKTVSPDPKVTDTKQTYTTRDGVELNLFIYKPASASGPLPLLVWYHGGGGCVGSADMMSLYCRNIALTHDCVVVSPQYRLAPEFKFPTGMLDSWDALQHIAQSAESYGADASSGFVVGGESYGAVVTAYVMLRARDEELKPSLSGAVLCAGSYVNPYNVPEQYKQNYQSRFDPVCLAAPGLSEQAKAAFDFALQPDYNSAIARATLWPTGHAGLPKTYFQTCGLDINRDEAFIYRDMLERSGVETRLDAYAGAPHCYWWSFPNAQLTRKWEVETQKGIAWLFGKTSKI